MSKENPVFFICYGHDASLQIHLDIFEEFFRNLAKPRKWKIWNDKLIKIGDDWDDTINRALKECDYGLLCLSDAFFASDYIQNSELPKLMRKAIPFLFSAVDFEQNKQISKKQVFQSFCKDYEVLERPNELISFSELIKFTNAGQPVANHNVDKKFVKNLVLKIEEKLKGNLISRSIQNTGKGTLDNRDLVRSKLKPDLTNSKIEKSKTLPKSSNSELFKKKVAEKLTLELKTTFTFILRNAAIKEIDWLYEEFKTLYSDDLMNKSTLRNILIKNPDTIKIIQLNVGNIIGDNKNINSIFIKVGCFEIFPLRSKSTKELFNNGQIDGRSLRVTDIKEKNVKSKIYYIGSVGILPSGIKKATEYNCPEAIIKSIILSELKNYFINIGKLYSYEIYTRPINNFGLKLVEKYKFLPSTTSSVKLNIVYRKTVKKA